MKITNACARVWRVPLIGVWAWAAASSAGIAFAQGDDVPDVDGPPHPLFAALRNIAPSVAPAAALQTWNGSFSYNSRTYTFTMVGTNPNTTNVVTTIPVYIIPLKLTLQRGGQVFDPMSIPANTGGLTALQNTVESPLFDSTTTYIQGGVNVGTTQYEDAYQRASFWGAVHTNTNYHTLLGGPTVLPEVSLQVPTNKGKTGTPFGETAAEVSINWLDSQIQSLITQLGIQPNTLPIFMTYKTYLTKGPECCIGGYHSAVGGQTYSEFTYVDQAGLFSQDVSALSHEIGEWMTDPLVNNQTACGLLEVGDPLEGNSNFGDYSYALHGFQYNLQDLVTLPYFGAPPSTSVNNFFTFQGESLTVCQNGS
ncbi:MAG: hypothetical protein JO323_23380 [Acidobacteriia bacterium]|nr:hypothetical protein [Terriglobia bacterium]